MNKYFAFLILGCVALVGCGGSSGGGISPASQPSHFASRWAGVWTSATNGSNGSATITVGPSGSIVGTTHDNGAAADGALQGSINSAGQITGTVQFVGLTATLSGTLSINQAGDLVGDLTETRSSSSITITVNLQKQ